MQNGGKVLVVDDYEPNMFGLRDLLEAAGYTVWTACDGPTALHTATVVEPDLVLLDVVMPGLSGVDVCKALKQNAITCLTPVVLISANVDRAQRLAGLDAGADDFLSKPVDPDELRMRVRSLIRVRRLTGVLESAETLFVTLGRIVEARDPCTEGHCERLASYATALGTRLGLERSELDALYRGGFLHDIGKIAIPDRVLLKKGRLDHEEYELMKQHPVIGDKLCSTVRSFEHVRPIIRSHHERLDGHGYPDGLAGEEIPLLAQIVSVVDVFDALTTDRPYRRALPTKTAYEMLVADSESGWCSRSLVDRFLELHRNGSISLSSHAAGATASCTPRPAERWKPAQGRALAVTAAAV